MLTMHKAKPGWINFRHKNYAQIKVSHLRSAEVSTCLFPPKQLLPQPARQTHYKYQPHQCLQSSRRILLHNHQGCRSLKPSKTSAAACFFDQDNLEYSFALHSIPHFEREGLLLFDTPYNLLSASKYLSNTISASFRSEQWLPQQASTTSSLLTVRPPLS